MTTQLFGPDRKRVGYEDQEWAVWVFGPDDVHQKTTLAEALELAAELNAMFAELHLRDSGKYSPVMYAVVLHWGYAWNSAVEHSFGLNCGHPDCPPCSPKVAS
ncbi:hypothetical protein OG592_27300 [Streptomyces avidinii]|uniref:hypothetical protein n=1 Tax=Streptomyces avidinii TaxID=1895 RepID=UPI00386C9FE5|nr:hypothetical protein OG592_27300 [Streptomyces avidinii]